MALDSRPAIYTTGIKEQALSTGAEALASMSALVRRLLSELSPSAATAFNSTSCLACT